MQNFAMQLLLVRLKHMLLCYLRKTGLMYLVVVICASVPVDSYQLQCPFMNSGANVIL
jgi:hypothetical protein